MKFDFEQCEKAIGYTFRDKNLLIQCFTHSSFANENKNFNDNERLEFFGDSILGFIVTEYLYDKFSKRDEGIMTERKQKIVSKKPLSKASLKFGFDRFLLLGEGEKKSTAPRESLCENLFEAIIAGIYLDGGLENAKKFVFEKLLETKIAVDNVVDYKGKLQEFVQKEKLGEISYGEIASTGPSHKPTFKMSVLLNGITLGEGEGESKKKAEQQAANVALTKIKTTLGKK